MVALAAIYRAIYPLHLILIHPAWEPNYYGASLPLLINTEDPTS